MASSNVCGIGLSSAAEQRWQQHLNRARAPVIPNSRIFQTARSHAGTSLAYAIPTQELIEEMTRDPDAPPLPPSFLRYANGKPFVPPEGEEWHVVDGFHVRISRAELDELLASDSDSEDMGSQADTSVGLASDCGEGHELRSDIEESSDEMGMQEDQRSSLEA
eukprot:TRINITY_DN13111_c0_g1_i1.p1 TRINITY_DN13111_c0_g1~~TRINITY_DN13111_c0_g1_i1.p1  ORF type:complete len:163 (+),score=31.70 TRINITY_DN13111_c0_g1_i1:100-588(+)